MKKREFIARRLYGERRAIQSNLSEHGPTHLGRKL
jgi:hypothetical protein